MQIGKRGVEEEALCRRDQDQRETLGQRRIGAFEGGRVAGDRIETLVGERRDRDVQLAIRGREVAVCVVCGTADVVNAGVAGLRERLEGDAAGAGEVGIDELADELFVGVV